MVVIRSIYIKRLSVENMAFICCSESFCCVPGGGRYLGVSRRRLMRLRKQTTQARLGKPLTLSRFTKLSSFWRKKNPHPSTGWTTGQQGGPRMKLLLNGHPWWGNQCFLSYPTPRREWASPIENRLGVLYAFSSGLTASNGWNHLRQIAMWSVDNWSTIGLNFSVASGC